MSALEIAATVAVLGALLITIVGMFLWLSGLVEQAEADASLEASSANKGMETFFVSQRER